MATKRELIRLVDKGNWDYYSGEYRCAHCGEYQFTGKHEENCPLGILLQLIKDSNLE